MSRTDMRVLVERSLTGRAWHLAEPDHQAVMRLAQGLGLPDVAARVLAARQVDIDDAETFLTPRLRDWLPDPSHLLGLDEAVARLIAAVEDGEPIGIVADYDADGATSGALLARYLEALGVGVHVEIPDRLKDGYGPNAGALARLAEAGCQLVLTLDSGTTAFEALQAAQDAGQDIVVVDHHQAEGELPPAFAVINPNRRDQESPLGDLAAVGMVFMLIVGLNRALRHNGGSPPDPIQWLDLVAVGTVCDVVPLRGLNRAFVAQGLKVAARTGNPGLKALCKVAGVEAISDARQLGFALGPRINAGGRLGRSALACQLLRSDHEGEAYTLASILDDLNKQRQSLERGYLKEALKQAEEQAEAGRAVLVASGEGWHQGVVGIVASRITETLHRPVFVIGWADGVGRGSGRSVAGIDLGALVIAARQAGILAAGGGHEMAAGLTIEPARLDDFLAFAQDHAQAQQRRSEDAGAAAEPQESPPIIAEATLSPAAAGLPLVDKLEKLAPFGNANEEPRLVLQGAQIVRPRTVGRGHVSCLIGGPAGGHTKAIAFRAEDRGLAPSLLRADMPLALIGKLRRDRYQGRDQAQFEIEDAAHDLMWSG